MSRISALILFLIYTTVNCEVQYGPEHVQYWLRLGKEKLKGRIDQHVKLFGNDDVIKKRAKNVVFFMGDGMGMSTITSMRIYKAQLDGLPQPERTMLNFENFPFTGLLKTHALDKQVTDSAAAATALATGVKTNYEISGLSGIAKDGNCLSSMDPRSHATSFIQWAQDEGKDTGFITTTRVTHATPAALYAHVPGREWEFAAPDPCNDTAYQLVNGPTGRNLRLILGGGLSRFLPTKITGSRNDSRNLIFDWLWNHKKSAFFTKRSQLIEADFKETEYLLGLFNSDHLSYALDKGMRSDEPSLDEMVLAAFRFFNERKNPKGYVLFVEGGKIDLAHHKNWAKRALHEGYEFERAVQIAINRTDSDETLLLVTADHSHSLVLNGYAKIGNSILGLAGKDGNGKPYTTLLYANGPAKNKDRTHLTTEEAESNNYQQTVAVNVEPISAHGGEDVPIYARGPGSVLFTGVNDQTFVAHAISYAACIGPHRDICSSGTVQTNQFISLLTIFCFIFINFLFSKKNF